jgi:hypothetical protein
VCILYRNNPKNVCRLEITVNSYFTVQDGKKVYNQGRTVNWFANPEEYALIDLEKDMDPYFKWGSNQKDTFWVLEKGYMQQKLDSDAQLLDLLRSSDLVKLFMIVGTRDEWEEMMHVAGEENPAATNVVGKEIHVTADVMVKEVAVENREEEMLADMDKVLEWREVPEYGQTTVGPTTTKEEESEHFMTIGCDPGGDEPTGANEEWRYFKFVEPVKNVQPVEVQKRKRARLIPDFDAESVPDDEVGLLDDNVVPHTSYDKENPVIKEGDTFEDKDDFLETIRTYAIKNEFETKVEHSDRG